MFSSIIQTFWPSINKEEVKKFSLLSLTLLCLIGSYWIMRLVKDVIMFKIAFPESLGWAANQGSIYQPIAKMWSVGVIFLVVGIPLSKSTTKNIVFRLASISNSWLDELFFYRKFWFNLYSIILVIYN